MYIGCVAGVNQNPSQTMENHIRQGPESGDLPWGPHTEELCLSLFGHKLLILTQLWELEADVTYSFLGRGVFPGIVTCVFFCLFLCQKSFRLKSYVSFKPVRKYKTLY